MYSCDTDEKGNEKIVETKEQADLKEETKEISKGFKLMEEKCFVCHFAKPDPSRRSEMIAPPMLRVQEHYKPNYKTKEEFVAAIKTWVNNPQEENTLMPGAIRKFKVMPKLVFEEEDLNLIAEALFEAEFGNMPKMNKNHHGSLSLNDGEKWKIKADAIAKVNAISEKLNNFKSEDIKEYNKLGKEVFDEAKGLLLDKSYSEETFTQLHNFFNKVETNMHNLIAATSIEEAQIEHKMLIKRFSKFKDFFVAE